MVRPAPAVILFDMDGTLFDSAPGITRSMAHALGEVGVAIEDPAELRWCVGPPLAENFARLGVTGDRAETARLAYRAHYDAIGAFDNAVFSGVPALLDRLHREGRTLAVATSKAEHAAGIVLDHFGLRPCFSVVAGAIAGLRVHKHEVVAHALQGLGHPDPATAVLVGDRRHDVVGARVHGLACIAVTWGYAEPGELAAAGPDLVVSSIEALNDALG